MVCVKVTKLYLAVRQSRYSHGRITEQQKANLDSHFCCMRATFIQAISYIVALFIITLPHLLAYSTTTSRYRVIRVLPSITTPLQGLFNLAIFVGAKVYHIRRADSEISIIDALREIMLKRLFEDDAEAEVLTGMPSARGARHSVPSSVSSSNLPSGLGRSTVDKIDDFSDDRLSTDKSKDISLSIGAWDDTSWISQSTKCRSGEISEFGSRGSLPDGLSKAPSGDLSLNLSLSTK